MRVISMNRDRGKKGAGAVDRANPIDGRQKLSDGATLEEMARIMLRYGCSEAVNLDGGGSTTSAWRVVSLR